MTYVHTLFNGDSPAQGEGCSTQPHNSDSSNSFPWKTSDESWNTKQKLELPSVSDILFPSHRVSSFVVTEIVSKVMYGTFFSKSDPFLGPDSEVFLLMGGKYTPKIVQGEVWRLFMPIILHANLLHLLSNVFFQAHVGFVYEKQWGVSVVACIYILSGLGGNLLSCLTSPSSVSVGASGALLGLLGGQMAFLITKFQYVPDVGMKLYILCMFIFVNLLPLSSSVDIFSHVGGLLSGFFIGASYFGLHSSHHDVNANRFGYIGVVCTLMYFSVTISLLLVLNM